MSDCLFCKIVAGEIPAPKIHEDEDVVAFHDISPQAPVHVLVVPKRHIASLDDASDDDRALQWFADNDHNWVIGKDYPCVELRRSGGEVELQVNLVRKSGVLGTVRRVRFGLIATPVKPLPSGWRNLSLHFARLCNARTAFFYGAGHGGGLVSVKSGSGTEEGSMTPSGQSVVHS